MPNNNITLDGIVKLLLEKERFLLLCHTNPDEDTVGSAYALYLALKKCGKAVRLACDMLPTPRCGAYVDRAVFEVADREAPMAGIDPADAFVISVDVASKNMLGALARPYEGRVDLKLDHHAIGEDFGLYNYTDPASGACGMIVYEIIERLGAGDEAIASALYLAIASDTGGFRYSNTSALTHRIAASLLEKGADGAGVSEVLFETKSEKDFRALKLGLSKLRYLCDGRVALMAITNADKEALGLCDRDLGELASLSRQTAGVLLGIVLKQTDGNGRYFRLSVRSREGVDAAALCARFGGGGHVRAAGGGIEADSLAEAEKRLLEAVYDVMKE